MRRTIDLTLSVTGLVALISAAGCSSEPAGNAGNGGPPTPFGQGQGGTANGAAGTTGQVGGVAGQGTGGTGEGQGGAAFNAGTGGTAMAAGGAAGGGPVVDVVSEPGLGFFTSGAWRGYAWTAIETDPVTGATVRTPTDFTALPDGEPYCLSGTVAADPPSVPDNSSGDGYQGFAMLGFNIAQAGVPEVEGQEPAVGTATPTGAGIALTFSQSVGPLRLQIQGPNPELATDRWCASLPAADAQGRAFVPYDAIFQECYLETPGPSYEAAGRPPLEAISFLVPGGTAAIPFEFCVDGFADGGSVEDAPASISGGGLLSGTLATNFGRQRIRGTDGELYVVQNNAWNEAAVEGNHRVQFEGNSFTVIQQSNGGQGSIPISFPSIFVGQNGFQGVGNENSTADTDGLPRAINEITSIQSTFNTNAGSVQGEYNATYDIWFANGAPAQAGYDDAEAAFLMVWTHKPGGKNPIGINPFATGVTIAGAPGTWDIWVGRRGENGAEDNLNNEAPVISYTPNATLANFNANLLAFINDAVQRSGQNGLQGFQFPATLTLTDIFGGFEIWSGGQGLSVSEFTVNVQ